MGNIMKYSGIIENDFSAAPGVCVTVFTQGCPHHCKGCHNPETWDFNGGLTASREFIWKVVNALRANNIHRDLCIMGGEPLCKENLEFTSYLVQNIKWRLADVKVYIWTGYIYEELDRSIPTMNLILKMTDCLIDGPYIEELRDITLPMRGSSNQRILYLQNGVIKNE